MPSEHTTLYDVLDRLVNAHNMTYNRLSSLTETVNSLDQLIITPADYSSSGNQNTPIRYLTDRGDYQEINVSSDSIDHLTADVLNLKSFVSGNPNGLTNKINYISSFLTRTYNFKYFWSYIKT